MQAASLLREVELGQTTQALFPEDSQPCAKVNNLISSAFIQSGAGNQHIRVMSWLASLA